MKQCEKCGTMLPDEMKFCFECGSPASQMAKTVNEPATEIQAESSLPEKKKSKKLWVFGIAGVMLVAVIALAVILLLPGEKTPVRSPSDSVLYVKENAIYRVDPVTGESAFVADYDTYCTPEQMGGTKYPGFEMLEGYIRYGNPVRLAEDGSFSYVAIGQSRIDYDGRVYYSEEGKSPERKGLFEFPFNVSPASYTTEDGRYTFTGISLTDNITGEIIAYPFLLTSTFYDAHSWFAAAAKPYPLGFQVFGNTAFFTTEEGLCRLEFGKEAEVIASLSGEYNSFYGVNGDTVYYTDRGVLFCWTNGESRKLTENVNEVLYAADNGYVYYTSGLGVLTLKQSLGKEPFPDYLEPGRFALYCYDGNSGKELVDLLELANELGSSSRTSRISLSWGSPKTGEVAVLEFIDRYVFIKEDQRFITESGTLGYPASRGSEIYFRTRDGAYILDVTGENLEQSIRKAETEGIYWLTRSGQLICKSEDIIYCDGERIASNTEDSLSPWLISWPSAWGVVYYEDVNYEDIGYLREVNKEYGTRFSETYTLKAVVKGEMVKIDEDVCFEYYTKDGPILYLKNINKDTLACELYLWKDGISTKIDDDVHVILPNY